MSDHVYTIAAGENFSKVFAQHLLDLTSDCPEDLIHYRIFLPTRRACRILRDAFLQLNDGKAMLLPFMGPIGEFDEQDLSLMSFGDTEEILNIPDAISPLQRQLMLSKLIQSMPDYVQGADHALSLAQSLCKLIDEVLVEELDFHALDTLVPSEFADHWQVTLDFLKIVTQFWPQVLQENNLIEPVERRRLLLGALSRHWSLSPPAVPIFAAGSTGSIPAVRRFLRVVHELPQGSVVLPGLDLQTDQGMWDVLEESHPQYILKQTLKSLDVDRKHVVPLGSSGSERTQLADLVMYPAPKSELWSNLEKENLSNALKGMQYFECNSEDEEARLISLLLRENLENAHSVCALVTPDRSLARRVSALCKRWGIEVDDSAGTSLLETDLGKLSLLILNCVSHEFNPIALLALMKSSLFCLGRSKSQCRQFVSRLELDVLRQNHVIKNFNDIRALIKDESVLAIFDEFYAQLQTLETCEYDFNKILRAHLKVMEAFSCSDDKDGSEILWRGDSGEMAAQLFTEMLEYGDLVGKVSLSEYAKIFRVLISGATVRSAYGVHPRLLILGQLESRLTYADRVILGGLNEGNWTSANDHDPWMSKPMRQRFGLPSLDQAVGIAAHDFVQSFCMSNVILTRSQKVDRSPSIPVRWISRFETVLKAGELSLQDLSSSHYFDWLGALDQPDIFEPFMRPEPKPPSHARPSGVSVTKVETWLQNPYAIYAYYVLKLKPLRPVNQDNNAALIGTLLHEILDRYIKSPKDQQNEDNLVSIARDVTNDLVADETILYYWWPKFFRIASWFIQHESLWQERAKFLASEVHGKAFFDIDGESFYLEGRADRIDRVEGGYALIDYKTGGQFTKTGLKKGSYPQMPLEAMMIAKSGFKSIENVPVRYLGYWKMTGGQKPGEIIEVSEGLEETLELVEAGFKELVRMFRADEMPFYCIPDLSNAPRFDDYALLSRVQEWASLAADDGAGDL